MLKKQEMKNRPELEDNLEHMKIAKANVYKQASMAVIAIAVTVVLVFAMSVAWYSNVIHTEGLVFQVSSWDFNFDGSIEVGTDEKIIAPGDTGIISLKLENKSDESISTLVNVTKNTEDFPTDMLKRIYFYVDDSQKINGEVVERIYVNKIDSYAYTVLAKNTLALNEEYHSDPYLKWEWVYDVVGYYVYGTMEDGKLIVDDYMRPITYDYDKAVFDNKGNLVSVDGGLTKKQFLEQLYKTDGYQGNTVPQDKNGYYPVAVEEESETGIWLYLCTQSEIDTNTLLDTQMAENAKKGQSLEFTARLLLSGQQSKEEVSQVANAKELKEQLSAKGVDRVNLSGNISFSDAIALADGKKVVLDLKENTLKLEANEAAFQVKDGSSLTIINGTIEGNGSNIAVESYGASVTLNNVVVKNAKRAVYIVDDSGDGLDSNVKINNCNFDTKDSGIIVRGNSDDSARKTYLLIEKSTITGKNYGVSGNGSSAAFGTEIEIIGSNIKGGYAGVYHPQCNSNLKITNSTVEGEEGIVIKAGEVKIQDTKVVGTGKKQAPAFSGSGFSDTGDAIYIETNYNKDIVLQIGGKNTVVQSSNSLAIQVFEAEAPHVNVTVMGGSYSSDVTDYVPEGYAIKKEANNTYYVDEAPATMEAVDETKE